MAWLSPPPWDPQAPMDELQGLGPPSTPSSSPPGSFPVAAATLPAQEKRCGRRMSGDGTRDRGGHAAGAGGLASRCLLQHGTLFYTGAKRTIPHVLYLFCFVYNCHGFEFFVYFVKKTGGSGGFFSSPLVLGLPTPRRALGMQVGLPGWCRHRCPCQHPVWQQDASQSNT